jgi:hypothetical protein
MAFEPVTGNAIHQFGTPMETGPRREPSTEERAPWSARDRDLAPPPSAASRQRAPQEGEQAARPPRDRPTPPLFSAETAEDVARSGISGAGQGFVGLLGLPGDVGQLSQVAVPLARYYGSRLLGTEQPEAQRVYDRAMAAIREQQTPEEREGRRGRLSFPAFGLRNLSLPTSSNVIENASFIPGIEYEPKTGAGRIAHEVGKFVGSAPLAEIAAPIQVLRGATTLGRAAQRVGQSAISPATIGGGLGSGVAGEFYLDKPEETGARLVGGLAGSVAAPSVTSLTRGAARFVAGSPETAALEAARRGLGQPGISAEEVARLAQAGHPVSAADIAGMRPVVGQAMGRIPESETAENVLSQLRERGRMSGEYVGKQIDDLYGKTIDPFVTARDAADEASRVLRPEYTRVFNLPQARAIWSPELQNLTNTAMGQNALNSAFTNLTHLRGSPVSIEQYMIRDAAGNLNLRPGVNGLPLEVWDQVKRSLDAQVKRLYNSPESRDASAATALNTELKRLRAVLDDQVKPYAQLRAEAQRYKLGENAFDAGQNLIQTLLSKTPENSRLIGEFNANLSRLSQTERNFLSQGVASFVSAQPDKAAQIFMAGDSRALRTLQNALGNRQFNQIRDLMTVHDISQSMAKIVPKAPRGEIPGWAGGVGSLALGMMTNLLSAGITPSHFLTVAGGVGVPALSHAIKNRNAERLLNMIASNDPEVLRRVAQEASRNPEISRTLSALGSGMRAVYTSYALDDSAVQPQTQQPQRRAGGRVGRASGGRLMRNDHSARAATLIRAAEAAKKAHNATTEGILEQPDEAVAKALSIANKAI